MKRLSKINESLWADVQSQASGNVFKKEDGTKVHTDLGVDIPLIDPNCKYNELMKAFFNKQYTYVSQFTSLEYITMTPMMTKGVKEKIENNEYPYIHTIPGYKSQLQLIIMFWTYDDILEFELDEKFKNEYCEKDYATICNCVGKKVQEVGDLITFIGKKESEILNNKSKHNDVYGGNYGLLLARSSTVKDWRIEHYNDNSDDFLPDLLKEFPELEEEDILVEQTVLDKEYILPIYTYADPIRNIANIRKYNEFVTNWFKV